MNILLTEKNLAANRTSQEIKKKETVNITAKTHTGERGRHLLWHRSLMGTNNSSNSENKENKMADSNISDSKQLLKLCACGGSNVK